MDHGPQSYRTKRRKINDEVLNYIQTISDESCGQNNFSGPIDNTRKDNDKSLHIKEKRSQLQQLHQLEQLSENDVADGVDSDLFQTFHSDVDELYSDSDGEIDGSDEINSTLKIELGQWASKYNISHASLSELLVILQNDHPDLPKDPRTLLGTQTKVDTTIVSGGEYYHVGIENGITSILNSRQKSLSSKYKTITLHVNIDGLPLFKSSNSQFWPILGMITACERKCPFVIGLYYGKRKPTDLEFLNEFVADYQNVEQNGIQVQGEKLTVVMTAIICDAPARAMVKNIKGHSGYSGCERCVQRGVYINKVTFPETEADHRTDQSFRNMLDENHHLGETPLSQLSLGMVSNFPLDYMHLVCLGVTRRLVKLWLKGPLKTRQSPQLIREISAKLQSLNGALPREFARQPRSLNEFERWKATELRQFLLYTGPVVLYRIIPKPFYENFMLLSVAMFIYLSPFNCSSYSQLGHQLIVTFIKHYATLYGNDMITYNVHGLVHLKEDVQQYGALDNVSCFPFESYLGQIKRMVRNANYPLQQVIRRLSENHVAFPTKSKELFEQPHNGGQIPETMVTSSQYKVLNLQDCTIKISMGDNCVKIGEEIVLARNFFVSDGSKFILYEKFCHKENVFTYPLDSTKLGIFKIKLLSGKLEYAPISSILEKYVLIPRKKSFVVVPLLHF